jgi:hypothetical protein
MEANRRATVLWYYLRRPEEGESVQIRRPGSTTGQCGSCSVLPPRRDSHAENVTPEFVDSRSEPNTGVHDTCTEIESDLRH